jgi:hypothetical protein
MRGRVTFTTAYYFPGRFLWAVVAGISAVALFAAYYYVFSALALFGAVVVLTTRYGVEINFVRQQYQEYTWVLGARLGHQIHFDSIRYLFIKDFKVSQTVNSRLNSSTFTSEEFRGFIKFDNEEKIHIITRSNHEAMVNDLKQVAAKWSIGLVDYSFGQQERLV